MITVQDDGDEKSCTGSMLGIEDFDPAAIKIVRIELLHRIRRGYFTFGRLRVWGQAHAIWHAVLSAWSFAAGGKRSARIPLFTPEPLGSASIDKNWMEGPRLADPALPGV